jgi:diadenosine tetraphosphate (Ap4A) HIT family hydrolase
MSVSVTLHSPFRLFSTRSCTDNWLFAHLRTHDWYLRSGHALWFCKKMSASCKDGTRMEHVCVPSLQDADIFYKTPTKCRRLVRMGPVERTFVLLIFKTRFGSFLKTGANMEKDIMLFIIRVKRELKRVYRHGCRYNERLNTETGGSKTPRIHWVARVNIHRKTKRYLFIYYESTKKKLKTKYICECRCYERLQTKTKEITCLSYTELFLRNLRVSHTVS